MGGKIPDTSHTLRLLRHLPPTWDGVCQVPCASQPTVAKVKDRLLAEEQARKTTLTYVNGGTAMALLNFITKDANLSPELQALVMTQFGSMVLNPDSKTNTNDKNSSSSNESKSKLRNPDLQCTNPNCLKRGHTKAKCWAKGGGVEGKGPKNKQNMPKNKGSDENTVEANLAEIAEIADNSKQTSNIATAWTASPSKQPLTMNDWVLDSGATTHNCPHKVLFRGYNKFPSPRSISTVDHGSLNALGIGTMWVKLQNNGFTLTLQLKNILYAPKCSANLLSINALDKANVSVNFC